MTFKAGDLIHILKRGKRKKKSKPAKVISLYRTHYTNMAEIQLANGHHQYMSQIGLNRYYYLW